MKLIAFEGIDGSGKSTQAQLLLKYLQSRKIDARLFSTSFNLPLSGYLQHVIQLSRPIDPELFLYVAAANYFSLPHYKNTVIIVDRYIDTSRASSLLCGISRSLIDKIYNLHRFPDMTFLFTLSSPEIAFQRKNGVVNDFETGSNKILRGSRYSSFHAYQADMQLEYIKLAQEKPESYQVLNAEESLSNIQSQIAITVEDLLRKP